MRIRYGKPIKIKSLVGKQDVLIFNNQGENISYIGVGDCQCVKQGSAYIRNIYAGVDVTLNQSHKYFILIQLKGGLANTSFHIYYANDSEQKSLETTEYKVERDKIACAILASDTKFRASHLYSYGSSFDVTSFADYYLLIDLTELGLDHLTAEEFYNTYNKFFSLLAAGEEITIDDKAGQINLKEVNSNNVISCKVAGGSSNVYYGYNQLVSLETKGNIIGGTLDYDESANIFTYTFGETIGHTNWDHFLCFIMANSTYDETHQYMSFVKIKHSKKLRVYNYPLTTFDVNQDGSEDWQIVGGIRTGGKYGTGALFYFQFIECDTNGWLPGESFQFMPVTTIDLTDWFGPGKEPATVEEFKERFAKEYYGFCPTPVKLTRYQIEALPNYGYNQLAQPITYYTTSAGFSWAHDKGVLTLSGSNITSTYVNPFYAQPIIADHKYLAYVNILSNSKNVSFQFGMLNDNVRIDNITLGEYWTIMPAVANKTTSIGLAQFVSGSDIGIIVGHFLMIDLTEWYGEGNEPTTIEEFKATFPNLYYPYSQKRLLNKYMINKLQA